MKNLLYLFFAITLLGCGSDDDNIDQSSCNRGNSVYLADNGVTIKACTNANIGDKSTIRGVEYTIVDRAIIANMIRDNEDVSFVCTTRITDMNSMFARRDFNQDLSSWDVVQVTNYRDFSSTTPSWTLPKPNF